MESTFQKIRRLYREMGPGEKKIADYLIRHASEVISLSVTELADRAEAGEATVVRLSRRLGFAGYQAMKVQLAREVGANSTVSRQIEKEDSCYDIFCKRSADIADSLQSTRDILDPEALETAVSKIMNAQRIVLFGLGNSAAIAADGAHKFLRLGLDAAACSDNHMQAIIASHLGKDCVALGISHSGSSKDVVEALELAHLRGAFTIAITNYGSSPITNHADLTLFTRSEETRHSILGMSSRIAALAILDAIYTAIVIRADKRSVQEIYNTEAALQNKKY